VKKEKQMTVEQSTDASFDRPTDWDSIDWSAVQQLVRGLQVRIAKATQAGKHRRANALQWLMTHSWSARLLAVRRVTTNRGAHTPGVDNVIWRTDKQKLQAADNLNRHGYKPSPLRRLYIPKKNGKLRPLSIPTLHDRAMQALHALGLAPIAETLADPNSYGFREGRRCADALEHVHIALSRKNSAPWVLEGDIRACFDEISHEWILQHVPMDKRILRQWLKAGYWEKGQLFPTDKGTPQGGIISPILANLTLDGMQEAIGQSVRRKGDKVNFVRYADDFIGTGATREILEQKVKPAATVFLQPRGLELSEQKTVITSVTEGFNFLGHTVRKFGDKLLTFPAKSNVQALRDKIRLCIQSALGLSQEALLRKLNPLLRGWANYYRNGAAKRTFEKLDYYVSDQLWRWAKRRHPNKSVSWRKQRYFSRGAERWNFSVTIRLANGESKVLTLYRMASTTIERHIKVRGKANPYDDAYTDYFEKRRCFIGRVREPGAKPTKSP
jgi:RNA-directed DNA polymerase